MMRITIEIDDAEKESIILNTLAVNKEVPHVEETKVEAPTVPAAIRKPRAKVEAIDYNTIEIDQTVPAVELPEPVQAPAPTPKPQPKAKPVAVVQPAIQIRLQDKAAALLKDVIKQDLGDIKTAQAIVSAHQVTYVAQATDDQARGIIADCESLLAASKPAPAAQSTAQDMFGA